MGNIYKRHGTPQNAILEIELFDVWGINFMASFVPSYGNYYILWSWTICLSESRKFPPKTNIEKVVIKFLKRNIFTRFGTPRTILSNGDNHFCNHTFNALLSS